MAQTDKKSRFKVKLLRPLKPDDDAPRAFVILPKNVSSKLPRRGRVTVEGTLNGHFFRAMLEPDGQLSHWLPVNEQMLDKAGADVDDIATFEIMPVEQEPDPEIPTDLRDALSASPEAEAVWIDSSTIARLDWIHWITSAKQSKTRAQRVANACDMLASGKRRVCCFDSSGYYSKAFSAPKAAD